MAITAVPVPEEERATRYCADRVDAIVPGFVYGTRSNVPDFMIKGDVTYRIISDHLVNATTGTVAQQLDYDEFGRVLSDSNPAVSVLGLQAVSMIAIRALCALAQDYAEALGGEVE